MILNNSKKIVIKIGSSLLINKNKINTAWVNKLADDVAKLAKRKIQIIIVTSGAIALGCKYLKISRKNLKLKEFQAVSAIGQIELINLFEKALFKKKLKVGQSLFTLEDTEERRRALNARDTIENIIKIKCIPIVNENDTTATSEIRYGDNERLAARVAQISNADTLIMLSDIEGLYTSNPNKNKNAELIQKVTTIDSSIEKIATKSTSDYGSGGMITKIEAAKICVNSGCNMIIASGKVNHPIKNIIKKKKYTWFVPQINSFNAKQKWILGTIKTKGSLEVDAGAANALLNGKSLLPVGIVNVSGSFQRGDTVTILNLDKKKLGVGVTSYSSEDIQKIKGLKSQQINVILGYSSRGEVIHIDNLVKEKNI